MQKSIFAKYFSVCAAIIIISISILGAVLLAFASQYFRNEKYDLLTSNVTLAAKFAKENTRYNSITGVYEVSGLPYFNMLGTATEADIFLVDANGQTLYCTEESPCVHTTYTIPSEILNSARESTYQATGDFGGLYKEIYYTVGVPFRSSSGELFGYVFASLPAKSLNVFLVEIFKMFLLASATVLLLSSVILYFSTRQMVKPLRDMSAAARRFGQGDFSTRLQIHGYDEVAQLGMALNNMASSLSIQENMSRSFVANVSHELKTPMTSIAGFIDGILDGTIPPEKQNHYLHIVSDEVKRMSRLVRSMLNLAKIEAGEMKLNCTSFNIVDTICQTVFSFEQQIEAKHLEIRGLDHDKLLVDADPDLIHQVIYNLTENAVKFVNEGGYLEFDLKKENGFVIMGVKNSGAGLTKDEIAHVFDRFYKTDKSRGLDKNGVGLGLYIVKSIVNLHQGEIMVRSVPGEYTEFVCSLPAGKHPKLKKS